LISLDILRFVLWISVHDLINIICTPRNWQWGQVKIETLRQKRRFGMVSSSCSTSGI
jgi:hypothetical protein